MKNTGQLFHLLSYLQYPLMLVVLYYYGLLILSMVQRETDWSALNNALIFLGIQVGFSTLQDTTKTQNKVSRKVWESPKKGKIMIYTIAFLVLLLLVFGLIGYFSSEQNIHKEISFGLIVLGIGILGMLKSAIEMFEHHRQDKQIERNEFWPTSSGSSTMNEFTCRKGRKQTNTCASYPITLFTPNEMKTE